MSVLPIEEVINFLKSTEQMDINISKQIFEERIRQLQKFGIQNHDDHTWLGIAVEEVGEIAKDINDIRFANKSKEFIELDEKLKVEMIQIVAVLVSWLNCKYRKEQL